MNPKTILYKNLRGDMTTRWMRENELARFKDINPVTHPQYGQVLPEPDEDWSNEIKTEQIEPVYPDNTQPPVNAYAVSPNGSGASLPKVPVQPADNTRVALSREPILPSLLPKGILGLNNTSKSNMSPGAYQRLDTVTQALREDSISNELIKGLSKNPPGYTIDPSIGNAQYDPKTHTIGFESAGQIDKPNTMEEMIHAIQMDHYGREIMAYPGKRKSIEFEAKMIQDIINSRQEIPTPYKGGSGDDYYKFILDINSKGGFKKENLPNYYRWGDAMDPEKAGGAREMDRSFSPTLLIKIFGGKENETQKKE